MSDNLFNGHTYSNNGLFRRKMDDRLRAACRRFHKQDMTLDQIWKIVKVETEVSRSTVQMAVKNCYRSGKDDVSKDEENAPDAYLAELKTKSQGFSRRRVGVLCFILINFVLTDELERNKQPQAPSGGWSCSYIFHFELPFIFL